MAQLRATTATTIIHTLLKSFVKHSARAVYRSPLRQPFRRGVLQRAAFIGRYE